MDAALDEMIVAIRAYAAAWTKQLRFASDHQHDEQLVRVAAGFTDPELRRSLLGMQGGVEEEPLTTAGVAEGTGLSDAEITELARAGKLFSRVHQRERYFPGWQFTLTAILPNVDRVITVLDKTSLELRHMAEPDLLHNHLNHVVNKIGLPMLDLSGEIQDVLSFREERG